MRRPEVPARVPPVAGGPNRTFPLGGVVCAGFQVESLVLMVLHGIFASANGVCKFTFGVCKFENVICKFPPGVCNIAGNVCQFASGGGNFAPGVGKFPFGIRNMQMTFATLQTALGSLLLAAVTLQTPSAGLLFSFAASPWASVSLRSSNPAWFAVIAMA